MCDVVKNIRNSQADTYIEERFEELCDKIRTGKKVLNQWRRDKERYISYTDISSFDFQHYSLHDKSHSISILRSIQMILGEERLNLLSISDLWLLLESAYCHDIGMSLTYEELCDLWKKDEFKKYVENCLYSEWNDKRKCAAFYKKLDALLKDKNRYIQCVNNDAEIFKGTAIEELNEWDDSSIQLDDVLVSEEWPIIFDRYILFLCTEYIRKQHPTRSRNHILDYAKNDENFIPSRLYDVLAKTIMLHGEEFNVIFSLVKKQENGLPGDPQNWMHPQFVAALLRLGDLLDMDSNRFNIRTINHMGILPMESILHMKKHKAIKNLLITEYGIEATASSAEFEVCKTTGKWFQWLDEEVNNLICDWNRICPPALIGCRLNKCRLHIYYKDEEFDAQKETKFVADSKRVYNMLIGENIYKSKLDFIREYLQNAMDASKMQLWIDLKSEKGNDKRDFTPLNIERGWYERYKIEIAVKIDWNSGIVRFIFKDHGIGMEKECISALSNVAADSWNKRKEYSVELLNMPAWLKPTGGFGIGIQSAFMITDKIEFITKSRKENVGRRICLESNKLGGKVSEYTDKTAEYGTIVHIDVELTLFLSELFKFHNSEIGSNAYIPGNVFDKHGISKVISKIFAEHISYIAQYSFIPIYVQCDSEPVQKIGYEFPSPEKIIRQNSDKSYTWINNELLLWDGSENAMFIFGRKKQDRCYYKGIIIQESKKVSEEPCSVDIVFYSQKVNDFLTISRDQFKFAQHDYAMKKIKKSKPLYMQLYLKKSVRDTDIKLKMYLHSVVMDCFDISKLSGEEWENIIEYFDKHSISVLKGSTEVLDEAVPKSPYFGLPFTNDKISLSDFARDLRKKSRLCYY